MTTINCVFVTFKNGMQNYLCALYSDTENGVETKKSTLIPINNATYNGIERDGLFEKIYVKTGCFIVSTIDGAFVKQSNDSYTLCVECEEMQCDDSKCENSNCNDPKCVNDEMAVAVTYEKVTYAMKCDTNPQETADVLHKYAGFGHLNFDYSIYKKDECEESNDQMYDSPKKTIKRNAPPNIKIAHRAAKNARGTKRKLETSDDDGAVNSDNDNAFSKAV